MGERDAGSGEHLSLFTAQGAPECTLRWHYRSRHESLIAVSNYEFYDNRLVANSFQAISLIARTKSHKLICFVWTVFLYGEADQESAQYLRGMEPCAAASEELGRRNK